MKFIESMGFKVFSDNLFLIPVNSCDTSKILNTISPNSYGISTKDSHFKEALLESDYLVLDGVYFALASIMLKGKNIKKNQGPEVFYHFMKRMNDESGRVFFLGASEQALEKIKKKAGLEYPNITVGFYSPPFKEWFSEQDNIGMINAINNWKPNVLFVGMTCPKQEKWSFENKYKIDAGLIICIGGVFNWYAGDYKEINKIWWQLRLGWFVRAIQRPNLLKRNIPNYWIFLKDLIKRFF